MSSTTPLLSLRLHQRKDFLDNLRCILTILLVNHHALIETTIATTYSSPIATFVTMEKAFLWGTFFFVSGYSTSLSQTTRTSNFTNFIKKGAKVNVPALFYAIVGQWALYTILSGNWPYIFGNNENAAWAYARFSGPIPYIILLFLFDSAAVVFRHFTIPPRLYPSIGPKSVILLGFIALTLYTFLNAALITANAQIPRFFSYYIFDTPDPSFPLSYILAYGAGWQFKILKRSILVSSSTRAVFGLLISTCISFASLYYAQLQWPSIARLLRMQVSGGPNTIFVDGGFNAYTIAYSIWSSFTLFSIPIPLISVFFHVGSTSAAWGWFGRKTYLQTYIHMIPIMIAEYHLRKVQNVVARYGLVGLVGLTGTWLSAYIVYAFLDLMTISILKIKRFLKW